MTYKEAAVTLFENENFADYSLHYLEEWVKQLHSLESNKSTIKETVQDLIVFSEQFMQSLKLEG